MSKYEMAEDILRKLNAVADANGALRCGLIWDMTCTVKQLMDALRKEDENAANHNQPGQNV